MSDGIPREVVSRFLDKIHKEDKKAAYTTDPVGFIVDAFGEKYHPWKVMADIMKCVIDNPRIAVASVNATGKSFVLAALMSLWWLSTKENRRVMIVCPSNPQVTSIFGYISQLLEVNHARHKSGETDIFIEGRVALQTELRINGVTRILGRSPDPTKARDTLQGFHSSGGTLVICDEASGLADAVYMAATRNATGVLDRFIAVCNPNDPDSYIGKLFKNRQTHTNYKFFTISAFDTPVYTHEKIPKEQLDGLISKQKVAEYRDMYGEDSPEYRMWVLGQFDYDTKRTIIRPQHIDNAYNVGETYNLTALIEEQGVRPVIGADLALYGVDNTVAYASWTAEVPDVYVRHNYDLDEEEKEHLCTKNCVKFTHTKHLSRLRLLDDITTNDVNQRKQAQWLIDWAEKTNASEIRFDATGLGAPFEDTLKDAVYAAGLRIRVTKMIASGHSIHSDRYVNDRAAWWALLRDRLSQFEVDIDPHDEKLREELLMLGYFEDPQGRLQLQKKDTLKHSPDYAEAFVFAALDSEVVEKCRNPPPTGGQKTVPDSEVRILDSIIEEYSAYSGHSTSIMSQL